MKREYFECPKCGFLNTQRHVAEVHYIRWHTKVKFKVVTLDNSNCETLTQDGSLK